MARVLLIGNHGEFKQRLEASGVLAGCEIASAPGNVDAIRRVRSRAPG